MLRNSPVCGTAAIGRPIETRALARVSVLAGAWLQRLRSRRALAELDERLLRDIGLSPSEAVAECAMPFWRPFKSLSKR